MLADESVTVKLSVFVPALPSVIFASSMITERQRVVVGRSAGDLAGRQRAVGGRGEVDEHRLVGFGGVSPFTVTLTVIDVEPGRKVSVPLRGT